MKTTIGQAGKGVWRTLAALAAFGTMGLAAPVQAAAPGSALIEGVLQSTGGAPAADGDYAVTFSIYASATEQAAAWTETAAKVTITGGRFSYALGSSKAIDGAALAALGGQWLGVKVGSDPELPRQALHSSIFARYAAHAGSLTCTGCLTSDQLANGSIAAAKIGFNYAGSSTKGGPAVELECTACVGVAEMKFDGDVDLAGNSIKAKNGTFSGDLVAATVTATSFVGDGSKLTGIKTPSGECKNAGEVVKGINSDGSLKCVAAMDPTALPKDGIDEISNGLVSNQFVDTIAGASGIAIPDNTGSDANATLTFPDIGIAQTFELSVDVANTDLSKVAMVVLPPDDKKTGWTLCDPCGKTDEKSYKVTFSKDNMPKSGDLTAWIGTNPKGTWNLKVLDTGYCVPQAPGNAALCNTTNKTDGSIVGWNIKIQTLSNKKINLNGDVYIAGKLWGKDNGHGNPGGQLHIANAYLKLADAKPTCDADAVGTLRWDTKLGMQVCDANIDNKDKVAGYVWRPANSAPVMWSGGCTTQPAGHSGWYGYCTNATEWNTAQDYLTLDGSATVKVKISGFYRIHSWAISHGCGHKHVQLVINGESRYYTHEHNHDASWHHLQVDQVWPLKAGDSFYVQYYSPSCNPYPFHSWNSNGHHSRYQIHYVGPLTK